MKTTVLKRREASVPSLTTGVRAMPTDPQPQCVPVRFTCYAPAASSVSVAGMFNNWQPDVDRMALDDSGGWIAVLELPPGRYEYRFVVDGKWCCLPICDSANTGCPVCVPNPFGSMNRVVDVT